MFVFLMFVVLCENCYIKITIDDHQHLTTHYLYFEIYLAYFCIYISLITYS